MDGGADSFFDANIEDSARQKIGDAIGNVERLGIAKSLQVQRFDARRLELRADNAANSSR